MSLRAVFERFLASPNPLSLTANASLHYITTLTTYTQSGPIIRHLESQSKNVVKKKAEKVISVVEGQSEIALETELTLEFVSGGGAYLPNLENFVTDRIATFPVMHVVHFDVDGKISQIRMSWDQGALLKQVDVIGSRGKNWPICDGPDQIRLIHSASKTVANTATEASHSTRGRDAEPASPAAVSAPARSMSPNKKHIKDPHASLDLFGGKKNDENQRESFVNPTAVRASARPPQRDMSELFAAGHEDFEPRAQFGGSPKKDVRQSVIATKGAVSQRHQPSRLFEEDADESTPVGYKSNPAKYNHFDLGEEVEDDPLQHKNGRLAHSEAIPMRAKTDKHMSKWGFEDFNTPDKVAQKIRGQDVRHFGWSDDEGDLAETPYKHAPVPKPRPDNQAHFEFVDDGPVSEKKPGVPRGGTQNRGMGLYENNLYDDEAAPDHDPEKRPLSTITNNIGRKNDFGSHWSMQDTSPAKEKTENENKPIQGHHKQAVSSMDAHWDTYDVSPGGADKPTGTGHLRKGLESHWDFGQDEGAGQLNGAGNANSTMEKNYWDF